MCVVRGDGGGGGGVRLSFSIRRVGLSLPSSYRRRLTNLLLSHLLHPEILGRNQ